MNLISIVTNNSARLQCLSFRRRLHVLGWRNRSPSELRRQITSKTLEVKSVEQFCRIHKLLKLDLSVSTFEYSSATGDGEERIFVRQVRSLDGQVTVVAEVEAVSGFEPVTFLLRDVCDHDAETSGDSHPLLEVAGVEFVGKRDEIPETER